MADQNFGDGVGLPIMSLANDEIIDAGSDISIREAAGILDTEAIGLLILKDGDKIAGLISERDIVRAVANGTDLDGAVSGIAGDQHIHWATPDATVGDVAMEMMASYVRHVLISGENGQPAGIVSMRDLLVAIIE